jgi:hypothetical protein
MKEKLLGAVRAKHAAVMEEALVNIEVYEKAVGIGEHPDLVGAVEEQVDRYVHALEMVEGVDKILGENKSHPDYSNTVSGKTRY